MTAVAEGLLRVRNEILTLRRERGLFLAGLEQKTRDRRTAVSQMLAQFSGEFGKVARQRRDRRGTFVSGLRRNVSRLQQDVKSDSGGAQKVFFNLRTSASAAQTRPPGAPAPVHHEDRLSVDGAETKAHPSPPKKNKEAQRRQAASHHRRRH